jgi:superfamily II DNA or RNA helicase
MSLDRPRVEASPSGADNLTEHPTGSGRPEDGLEFAWSAAETTAGPVPCLRLFSDRITVDRGKGFLEAYEELEAPLIELAFDYGGTRVAAADLVTPFGVRRDPEAENRARYLLETFGAVELGCLEHVGEVPESGADYIVHPEADVHAVCTFGAWAVPQLRALGWRVEVDPTYKHKIVGVGAAWYAEVHETDGEDDWFSLELGIDVDGRRINLLPALLELLDAAPTISSLATLARSRRRFVAVPLGDDTYLPVPPERLRALLLVVMEMWREGGPDNALTFPALHATSLARLDEAFGEGGLHWAGDAELRERGTRLAAAPAAADVLPPKGLRATLRPYQQEGLAWLQHLRSHDAGGILADDMGLGKTLQTIAHLLAEKEAGRMDRPSLVVAPTSLVGNWNRELRRFAPTLRKVILHGPQRQAGWDVAPAADVIVTTYGLLVRDRERFEELDYHYVILDEAQTIKNVRSQSHKAGRALEARHRLCLTGTPVENNLDELWSLFNFLMPNLLGDPARFRSAFRLPIERDGAAGRLEALRERVAPFILRRMKNQVATELPPKTELIRPVEITGAQRDLYESIRVAAHARVRSVIRQKGLAASTITILDALMKLRQVCCDPRLVAVDGARDVKESAKYALLFEMLGTQLDQGRRVLVFSQFTSMLALIAEGLRRQGVAYAALTGSTGDRQKVVDRFERGHADVFLISLKAGGTGLNLTSADTVIHYDPWWNPAAQAQATDRAYRIGQTQPVFAYNLIVAGSVEARIMDLQRRKRRLAEAILAPGGGGGFDFGDDEVDGLFAPLDD